MTIMDTSNLPPQASPITADGGIIKITLRPGDPDKPPPTWKKGSNAKIHFVTSTYAVEDESETGKSCSHNQDDAHHHHHHEHQHKHGHGHVHPHACNHPAPKQPAKPAGQTNNPYANKRKIRDTREWDDGSSSVPAKPFEMRIGRKFAVPGLETAVQTLRIGERAKFLVMPTYAEGYVQLETFLRKEEKRARAIAKGDTPVHHHHSGCAAGMSAELAQGENKDLMNIYSAPLEFDIELIDVKEPGDFQKEVWEMTTLEKYEEAPMAKERGGDLYRKGMFEEAKNMYARALALLESLNMSPEVLDAQRDERDRKARQQISVKTEPTHIDVAAISPIVVANLTDLCRLNYAACALKLQDYTSVITQCTQVLKSDPRSAKALFRRGQAYLRVGRDLDLAEKDFKLLVSLELMKGDEPEFVAEQKMLAGKVKAAKEMERKIFSGKLLI